MFERLKIIVGAVIIMVSIIYPSLAAAQQRTFINGGFELNDPQGPGAPTFEIFNDSVVAEWTDDTGFIELWDSGFQGITAAEGNVFGELNAHNPGTLYQNVCLINGETLGWSFAHRARSGGSAINPQNVIFEISDNSGGVIQPLASQASFIGDPWSINTGSVTYAGPTSVVRARFRTTNPGSYGNFLDDIQLHISAFAQMSVAASSDLEASGGNIPSIQIYGRIDTATTIPVTVTGGTANAADYVQTAASVTIPIGTYGGETFPLPITITDDTIGEDDDTLIISLGTPSTSEILFERRECDGAAPITSTTYTIINDDGRLEAAKSVAMYETTGPNSYALPGADVIYTIRVTNTGNIFIDSGSVFLVDRLPAELHFYNGDIDDLGPETNPVSFTESGSGMSFTYGTDVGFSDSATAPIDMTQCNFTPAAGYVNTVQYICFAPQGNFSSGDPDPYFEVSFRMQID